MRTANKEPPQGSGSFGRIDHQQFYPESEGVLMIITSYGLIIFQLVVWIGVVAAKSRKSGDEKYGKDMLGFSYPSIPTRHEVCIEPNLREDNTVYD